MSNHVHILIWPKALLPEITKAIKGFTAREANRVLGRTGQKFWQDESFDHAVRSEDEFYRIMRYIERNPVKAGLVESPEQWPWSSAARKLL
jgi:putative transposase